MEKPLALLIEDDRDISTLFRTVLDMAGYRTEAAFNGVEGLDGLSANTPDVVLLDLQLPGISGVEILQKMKADERLKTVPVVVITAFAYYANSLPVEPDMFLLKPVDIHDLSTLIQRLRSTKETMHEQPYDEVTHLHTVSFFSVRLVFALERVKHYEVEHFGVFFANLHPIGSLREKLGEEIFNAFLRKMADVYKNTFRPADTVAWAEDGCFLTLLDDLGEEGFTETLATEVVNKLNRFIAEHLPGEILSVQTGLVLCNNEYESVQEILDDIAFARTRVAQEPQTEKKLFTHTKLQELREA